MLSEDNWRLTEMVGCSHPYPCIGGSTMMDSIHMDTQCCDGHLCTDGNFTGILFIAYSYIMLARLLQFVES